MKKICTVSKRGFLLCSVMLLCLFGCTDKDGNIKKDTVEDIPVEYVIMQQEIVQEIGTKGDKEVTKQSFLVLTMEIKNNSQKEIKLDEALFGIQDGKQYYEVSKKATEAANQEDYPAFYGAILTKGEKAKGKIIFELPKEVAEKGNYILQLNYNTKVDVKAAALQEVGYTVLLGKDDLNRLIDSKEESLYIYFGRDSCEDCQEFWPILESYISQKHKQVFVYDTEERKEDADYKEILDKYQVESVPMVVKMSGGKMKEILDPLKEKNENDDQWEKCLDVFFNE